MPDWCDDCGGDHHLFGAVLGPDGQFLREFSIKFWSDGFEQLGDPTYAGYIYRDTKLQSGWANIPIFSSFVPERGESGPWCWTVSQGAGDVVCGGGLPANQHVTTFVVWQAVPASEDGGTVNLTNNISCLRSWVVGQIERVGADEGTATQALVQIGRVLGVTACGCPPGSAHAHVRIARQRTWACALRRAAVG